MLQMRGLDVVSGYLLISREHFLYCLIQDVSLMNEHSEYLCFSLSALYATGVVVLWFMI